MGRELVVRLKLEKALKEAIEIWITASQPLISWWNLKKRTGGHLR